ncbi:MAG TPA: FkbM family methyltransferase [Baekduia sp.]|nr:FkbM family methyltransferase [Baekduia sp.]
MRVRRPEPKQPQPDDLRGAVWALETGQRLAALTADPIAVEDVVFAQTDVGTLALHAHDRVMTPIICETGRWEEDEAAWLRSVLTRGQTVVDCGANVGYFTLLLSEAVGASGTVVAVEPERGNLRLLQHNLWRNRCDNVRVIAAAAGEARGVVALRHNSLNAGDHQVHAEAAPSDVLVPCVALDDLLGGVVVDVVKVDTQGHDYLAVAGMHQLLERSPHARLLVEFWLDSMVERNISADDVLAGYRALGRPIGTLGPGGVVREATDAEIIASAAASQPDHWVNIVIGARTV